MKSIIEQSIINFVFCNIVCHFGILMQIIMDNNTQFLGKKLGRFYEDNKIKLSFASVYHL